MSKKIVIDAGHGGEDPGTISNGIIEKDYTLKISKYIADRLNEMGIENALSRTKDETLDSNKRPKLIQDIYGKGNDVIVVSNHINAGGGDGAEIIYALRNNDKLSSKIAREFEIAGQNVRKYYQRRLPSNPAKDYYYIMRDTPNNETIIVEYGFADSKEDDVMQLKNNWKDLAEGVVKALVEYVGGIYKPLSDSNYYVVKKGDSLWSIARKFNITVDELKMTNKLDNNLLNVGQNLKIPLNDNANQDKYIVKKGDTLYGIAQKYNVSVNELKEINNLSNNNLFIGQILNISKSNIVNNKIYKVKSGDNLYNIAKKYGTSVNEIKELNNLKTNVLSIGQELLIPTSEETEYYEVKRNDTLYNIAKMFNTSVEKLKSINNLDSNTLSIGQKLLIR